MIRSSIFQCSFFLIIGFLFLLNSCEKEKDSDKKKTPTEEISSYNKIQDFTQGDYTFYLYTNTSDSLRTGYNEVYIQLKNNKTAKYIEDANLSWFPAMQMNMMSHGCPYSAITKVEGTTTVYKGYFVFVMASNPGEDWHINYYYTKGNDTIVNTKNIIKVAQSKLLRYKTFKAADGIKYVLALVNPVSPRVGTNEITAHLFKASADYFSFTPVIGATIKIDPRMPDMENHTSPNNINLAYNQSLGLYKGTVNFTMTGYWKVNLQVVDSDRTVLTGNEVTMANKSSSAYFEIEF